MKYTFHILIYNLAPEETITRLVRQIVRHREDIGIRIWDDGSDPGHRRELQKLKNTFLNLPFVVWKWGAFNVGRAAMRQRILESAEEGWNICLDGDMIPDENFVSEAKIQLTDPAVIYSGHHYYDPKPPPADFLLHWHYGRQREIQARRHHPQRHFTTGIFAYHRSMTERISFDKSLTGYGHEDTIFGWQLEQKAVPVQIIPLNARHAGLEENRRFLRKQEESVRNLVNVLQKYPDYRNRLVQWGNTVRRIPVLRSLLKKESIRNYCIRKLQHHPDHLYFLDLFKLHLYLNTIKSASDQTTASASPGQDFE